MFHKCNKQLLMADRKTWKDDAIFLDVGHATVFFTSTFLSLPLSLLPRSLQSHVCLPLLVLVMILCFGEVDSVKDNGI